MRVDDLIFSTEVPPEGSEAMPAPEAILPGAILKESDAIEIWIARWLRVPRKVLIARYGCDSRRLYEVWWGDRFPASRARAAAEFRTRYPRLADRTVFGYRRIPTVVHDAAHRQADLFS